MCWPNCGQKYEPLNYDFSTIITDGGGYVYAVFTRGEDKISLDISSFVYKDSEDMLQRLEGIEKECKNIKCSDAEDIRDELKAILTEKYK